jgi:hypothetical protein
MRPASANLRRSARFSSLYGGKPARAEQPDARLRHRAGHGQRFFGGPAIQFPDAPTIMLEQAIAALLG